MNKPKIVAVVGSLRKGSYNRQLAEITKEIVRDRAEFEILEYADVPLFNQDIEKPAPESIERVREQVEAADAIWFFNPEYNHFFSGVLKNLLDWLSRPRPGKPALLENKCATITGTTPGTFGTICSLNHLVTLLCKINMKVMNKTRVAIPNISSQLDESGKVKLTTSQKFLDAQVDAFLTFIEKEMEK